MRCAAQSTKSVKVFFLCSSLPWSYHARPISPPPRTCAIAYTNPRWEQESRATEKYGSDEASYEPYAVRSRAACRPGRHRRGRPGRSARGCRPGRLPTPALLVRRRVVAAEHRLARGPGSPASPPSSRGPSWAWSSTRRRLESCRSRSRGCRRAPPGRPARRKAARDPCRSPSRRRPPGQDAQRRQPIATQGQDREVGEGVDPGKRSPGSEPSSGCHSSCDEQVSGAHARSESGSRCCGR